MLEFYSKFNTVGTRHHLTKRVEHDHKVIIPATKHRRVYERKPRRP